MSHDNKHNNSRCGCCPFCRYEDGDTGALYWPAAVFVAAAAAAGNVTAPQANDKENAVGLNEGSVEIRGLNAAAQITIPVTVPPGASPDSSSSSPRRTVD